MWGGTDMHGASGSQSLMELHIHYCCTTSHLHSLLTAFSHMSEEITHLRCPALGGWQNAFEGCKHFVKQVKSWRDFKCFK